MVSEEQLDRFRQSGETVRVVRDGIESNDVLGIVVAWDDESVVIRKPNRRVVKVSRRYIYQPASENGRILLTNEPYKERGHESEEGLR
ncbi:hypothetical protein PACILC2_20530 [Paenibacillus cisolokensis]|uniref:DUF2187 domain-containing protein n=1 Tax=Paenibacillus cisolokensis TaxID=1658519 RepID=A0ABQ4N5R3_9BACL|nr:hypothetical protein [Paenibacillus cisolokensis]GIQ63485.1 hypothetical protein PACILC2_20530 [Paenibacillus cisolokensis]